MPKKRRFDFTKKNKRSGKVENVGYLDLEQDEEQSRCSLYFYGDIVSATWESMWYEEDRCPQDIADFLNQLDGYEDIDIYFNSGGGDVFAGLAIYNQLKRYDGHKVGYVDGMAASIACFRENAVRQAVEQSERMAALCHSPHIMDADLLMQTIAEVLKKIEDYSISNRAEFEALVKKNLVMQQTDQTKKQQKRIPQITTRLEQIDKVLNKLYEDNALGTIPQDRYEQILFNELVLSDKLFEHCAEIDEAARNRMELIVRSLAEQNGVTEQLKADNQMEWVRQMNACKAQAEEIVKAELIYD